MASRGSRDHHASGPQLWRLNQQNCLRLDAPAEAFTPGEPLDRARAITTAEAKALLQRLLNERYPGLERFPKAGEMFSVREDGLLVPFQVAS